MSSGAPARTASHGFRGVEREPPANTASRRSTRARPRSKQLVGPVDRRRAASAGVRPRVRCPPVSSRKRSSRRAAISAGRQRAPGPRRARSRAGCRRGAGRSPRPPARSRRRPRSRRTRCGTSTNSRTASLARASSVGVDAVGHASERNGQHPLAATPSPSRLVASTATPGQRGARLPTSRPPASSRCSQLSSTTSSSLRPRGTRRAFSMTRCPGAARRRARRRRPAGTASAVAHGRELDRATTPSRKVARASRRDLHREPRLADPADAGERHQSLRASAPAIAEQPSSRPTNDVSCRGQIARTTIEPVGRRGKLGREFRVRTW